MPEEIWLTFSDPHWWPTEEEGDIKYIRHDAEQLMELRKAAEKLIEAAQLSLSTPGLIRGRDELHKHSEALRAVLTPKQPEKETR